MDRLPGYEPGIEGSSPLENFSLITKEVLQQFKWVYLKYAHYILINSLLFHSNQ